MQTSVKFVGIFDHIPKNALELFQIGSHFIANGLMHLVSDRGDGTSEILVFTKPRIVSAAAQFNSGLIIPSPRHYDKTFHNLLKVIKAGNRHLVADSPRQGFIDQFGCFYNRNMALKIALDAGQVNMDKKTDPKDRLFSEDLY